MSIQSRPSFGKRNVLPLNRPAVAAAISMQSDIDAVDGATEMRAEDNAVYLDPIVVRDSLLAALLAGAVVGGGLACLDIAGIGQTFKPLSELLALDNRSNALVPFMILCGLMGGCRAAATTLLIGHPALKHLGQSSPVIYAFGGTIAAACYTIAVHVLLGQAPTHGWLIDLIAGGICGFLYRSFAGTHDP